MHYTKKQCALVLGLMVWVGAGVLLMPMCVKGQVSVKPGVRVGGNASSFGGDAEEYVRALADLDRVPLSLDVDVGRRMSVLVGGYALVDFPGPFAAQPEMRYLQQGADFTVQFQELSRSSSGSVRLSYLDIPVLARYRVPIGGGGLAPHLLAGPRVGFNLVAESDFESLQGGRAAPSNISNRISGTDFGLEFGGGVDVGFGAVAATVDLRYGLGLINIDDEENSDLSLSNRSLMVTAGVRF